MEILVNTSRRILSTSIRKRDLVGLHDITEEYGLEPFEVNANSMERTLCDKAFALCDYYLAGEELRRHSRHIYDLRKLQGLVSFDEDLAALFAAVRKQRLGKPRCLSADQSVDLAAVLRDLAENEVYKNATTSMSRQICSTTTCPTRRPLRQSTSCRDSYQESTGATAST